MFQLAVIMLIISTSGSGGNCPQSIPVNHCTPETSAASFQTQITLEDVNPEQIDSEGGSEKDLVTRLCSIARVVSERLRILRQGSISWLYLAGTLLILGLVLLYFSPLGQRLEEHRPYRSARNCILIVLLALTLFDHFSSFSMGGDFRAYHVGGLAIRHNISIDDREALEVLAQQYNLEPRFTALNYPPFWYVLFSPIASLSHRDFFTVITIFNHIFLALIFLISFRLLARLPMRLPLLAGSATLLLLSYPVRVTMYDGQANLLVALLLCLLLIYHQRGREIPAGISLGLAIGIKLFPLILLFPLAIMKRWRTMAAALLSFSLTIAVSLPFAGFRVVWNYFWQHKYIRGTGAIEFDMKQSIASVAARIAGYTATLNQQTWIWIGMAVSLACLLGLVVFNLVSKRSSTLMLGLWFLAILLCSPHTLFHHLTLLIPVGFLMAKEVIDRRKPVLIILLFTGWFFANIQYGYGQFNGPFPSSILFGNLFFWGMVILSGLMVYLLISKQPDRPGTGGLRGASIADIQK